MDIECCMDNNNKRVWYEINEFGQNLAIYIDVYKYYIKLYTIESDICTYINQLLINLLL